jgi:hypothetical protein
MALIVVIDAQIMHGTVISASAAQRRGADVPNIRSIRLLQIAELHEGGVEQAFAIPLTLRGRLQDAFGQRGLEHPGLLLGPQGSPRVVEDLPQQRDGFEIEIRRLAAIHGSPLMIRTNLRPGLPAKSDDSLAAG